MKTRINSHRARVLILLLAVSGTSTIAHARTEISPYIEVDQVAVASLKGDKDFLTYTTAAAGIDASISNNRTEIQLNYRYEHRFSWDKNTPDDDVHTGLMRGQFEVLPETLSIEAGALATRTRTDLRGDLPLQDLGGVNNVSQLYSVYAGPSFATNVGPVDLAASYRLGYTRVDDGEAISLPTGQDSLRSYDDSVSHYATASVGMDPGVLPFGWTVSGSYEREKSGQIGQKFEGKHVRGDIVFPVTDRIALVGGAGYEDIQITEGAPAALVYNEDGIYWDAGVIYRPSDRFNIEARVGRRYGSMSYSGSASWQPTQDSAINLSVFDELSTFGQQLNDNLSRLPTTFGVPTGGFGGNLGGCVFANSGSNAGGCFNPALQSISDAAYRSRGAVAVWSAKRGRVGYGIGGGYVQRKYVTPLGVGLTSLNGVQDETMFLQAFAQYKLTRDSELEADVYANWNNSGIPGAPKSFGSGATGTYTHNFGRLSAIARMGVYAFEQQGFQTDISASGQLGMRYQF